MNMHSGRTERDSIGDSLIPEGAAWGSQTQRALENFPITGIPISHYPEIVVALAQVKKACALTNAELGVLRPDKEQAIVKICDEIIAGQHHNHFAVDVMQGGAGTSTNMNANEVIANLALRDLGAGFGDYARLHPNDDVNKSQSTNDVYPTAIRLATLAKADDLTKSLSTLVDAFRERGEAFAHISKVGRTQLQDAVPMTLGQEFNSFANTLAEGIDRIDDLGCLLTEVNLGGTAIGTRINTPEAYGPRAVMHLSKISGLALAPASDLIEASSDLGAFVMFSGALKRVAIKLSKICNDLRLLSSGPRAGLGEIILPPAQAGSSIMPGKVNPVIPEVVNQICYQAIGNDLTVTLAAEAGQLQLNAMEPVIFYKVMETMATLASGINVLAIRCVQGIQADEARCAELLDGSLVLATLLAPVIGYDAASRLSRQALAEGVTLREVCRLQGVDTSVLDTVR